MLEKLKTILATTPISPISWLVGLSGIMMVRFFLEALSSPTSSGIVASDASTLVHYCLFFLGVALATLIILYFALPKWRNVLPQFVASAFVLILLAPILDFVISKIVGASGFTMTYLFDTPKELLRDSLTFFGPNWRQGITIGIRIELAIILFASAFLIYKECRHILKTIGFVLLLYFTVFCFGAFPSFLALGQNDVMTFLGTSIIASATFTNNIHSTLFYSSTNRALEIGFNFLMAKVLFLLCITLAGIYFYLAHKEKLIAVFKNSRLERVLAYISMAVFGMLLSFFPAPPVSFGWNDYISIIVFLLAFYFSWIFAVSVNDIVDEEIDKISNSDRPLAQNTPSVYELKQISYLALVGSCIAGYLSGFYVFFCVLAFTAIYYIYSAPPTRFKQVPFFSSFLISLCKLSVAFAGFFLLSSSKMISIFPVNAILGIVIFFTLFVGLRDLKDIVGDRANGIQTAATLFGPKFIGLLVSLAYLLVPFFFGTLYLFVLAIPAAAFSYYFCTKEAYREFPLFVVYFGSILTLFAGMILFLFIL